MNKQELRELFDNTQLIIAVKDNGTTRIIRNGNELKHVSYVKYEAGLDIMSTLKIEEGIIPGYLNNQKEVE